MRRIFEWIKYSDFYKEHIKYLKFTMFLRKIRDVFVLSKRRVDIWLKAREKKEDIVTLLGEYMTSEEVRIPEVCDPVDVIVPIYNGYDYLVDLFPDLLRTQVKCRYILVDDNSPDERVRRLEKEFVEKNSNAILLENPENGGFVKTANRGLAQAKGHAVLVNTDTRLPEQWLERMLAPILTDEKVASTTPYTNSGTIFSFPNFGLNNDIYLGKDTDTLDSYFRRVRPQNTEVPTGVGFCMAMSKKALEEVGLLDEETFGRGFGEENDWCQRAKRKGYKNVSVENLFVYHRHGGSFLSDEKQRLIEDHLEKLVKKHRTYNYQVQRFINKDPNQKLRRLVQMIIDSHEKRSVLYFDHNLGGGATSYMNMQIGKLLAEDACVFTVRYVIQDQIYEFDYYVDRKQVWSYTFTSIEDILTVGEHFHFDEIYINELVTYPMLWKVQDAITRLKEQQNGQLIMLFHDYFALCPSINLLDGGKTFCGDKTGEACEECYRRNQYEKVFLCDTREEWLNHWREFLQSCTEVRCFSRDTLDRAKAALGAELAYTLVPHEVNYVYPIPKAQKTTSTLNIGLLGMMTTHKGGEVVRGMVREIEDKNLNVNICLIGEFDGMNIKEGPHFHKTGKYVAQQLPKLIYENDIDIFFVASVWPETFSYTTEEIMKMGFPVAAFDWGAPAERVGKYEKGCLIDHKLPPVDILDKIQDFAMNTPGIVAPRAHHKRVLYVAEYLSFSSRYRLEHLQEELLFRGWQGDFYQVDKVPDNLDWNAYGMMMVYRCRYQDKMKSLIETAKAHGLKIFYDIDDLIFDREQMDFIPPFDREVYGDFEEYSAGLKMCMTQADKLMVSTDTLCEAAQRAFGADKEILVNRNVASMEMVGYSAKAREYKRQKRDKFIIGYFSGSNTHNEDFADIAEQIYEFMRNHDDVLLKIVGCMELPEMFSPFGDRILRVEFLPWEDLPEEIASVDVNLMPLHDSFFHHCKSENKWMEAALVEVATIATDYEELRRVTRDGENILLCQDKEDWYKNLQRLYEDKTFRATMAGNAHGYVLDNKTTFTENQELLSFIED